MSRHFTATAEAVASAAFHCAGCDYRGTARVRGEGEGEGMAPYFLGSTAAARRAVSEAERKAHADAARLLAIVPCPRCGRRDRQRARTFIARGLVRSVLPTVVAVTLYVLSIAFDVAIFEFLGLPIIMASLIFGPVGGARYWKQWTTAKARVDVAALPPVKAYR